MSARTEPLTCAACGREMTRTTVTEPYRSAEGCMGGADCAAVSSADGWATLEAEARTLYERKMHAASGLTLAEDNRLDGILTVDLPAVLAALRRLRERNEQLTEALSPLVAQVRKSVDEWYTNTTPMADLADALAVYDAALSSSRRLGEPE